MPATRLEALTFKLPASLSERLSQIAAARGISRSALLREAVERLATPVRGKARSAGDLAGDLAGCLKGPGDLSTNPKYMKDFGR